MTKGYLIHMALEALLAAPLQWPRESVPENPRGWLIQAATRRMTDYVRRERHGGSGRTRRKQRSDDSTRRRMCVDLYAYRADWYGVLFLPFRRSK
jgi:predicted RNA polymerase sigma factor